MDRIIDRVTVPQHSVRAALGISSSGGETLHTDRTLNATSDSIARLVNGLTLSVAFSMDYPGFVDEDKPWKLNLVLNDESSTSYNIYLSDGKPAKEQILSESQILEMIFLRDVETVNGTVTGWFVPNLSHTHDGRYYTQEEIDEVVTDIDNELELRTLIDRGEMEDLLLKYQEYTGTEGSSPGDLPNITTPPIGETTANTSSNVMNSGDVSDLLYDLHMPVPYEVNYNYVTPEATAAIIDTEGVAMDSDDAATLLRDIHNTH